MGREAKKGRGGQEGNSATTQEDGRLREPNKRKKGKGEENVKCRFTFAKHSKEPRRDVIIGEGGKKRGGAGKGGNSATTQDVE